MKKLTIVIFIPLFFAFSACGSKDLSRGKAEALLSEALKDSFVKSCSLHALLLGKPEFMAIKDEQFCKKSLAITGIRKTSATEAVVEYKIITKAKSESLRKWLDAMNKLEGRLLTLPPTRKGGPLFFTSSYRDPEDGQIWDPPMFSGQTIKDTEQWKTLQNMRQYCSNLLEKGQLDSKPLESIFRLYDDGWRIFR